MQYRRLGQSGLKLSAIALGGWINFGEGKMAQDTAAQVVRAAWEGGIRFFDLADIYGKGGAESQMGALLREYPRHHLVLSSKVFWPMSDEPNDRGLSRKHVMESIEGSLRRLQTDYLDLYFCHRPDPETPLLETARAMDDLVHQGKILYWGTSEWPAQRVAELLALCERHGLVPPVVEQPQYSMLVREPVESSLLPVARDGGMGLVVWSPLAMGMLTGKYDDGIPQDSRFARETWVQERYVTEANVRRVRALKEVAGGLGVTRAQLALAWTLRLPEVTSAIIGATRPEQVRENVPAGDLQLDEATIARIEGILAA